MNGPDRRKDRWFPRLLKGLAIAGAGYAVFAILPLTRELTFTPIERLYRAATVPENVYRHRWRKGDVLAWDNRCTMHYAIKDYDESMPRLMHRTTAGGEVPV